MDLANLKNIDVNELFNKLKNGGLADKKTLIKFGIGFGAVFIFLIFYYVFVAPKVNVQEEKLRIMNENKEKITEFNNNIGTLKDAVTKLEPEYEKNSKLDTLISNVASPGGTTEAALKVLTKSNANLMVILNKAILAANNRSIKLGENAKN